MTAAEVTKMKNNCIEAGMKCERSPSDRSTKTPSAGVGLIVQKDITFVKAEKRCAI